MLSFTEPYNSIVEKLSIEHAWTPQNERALLKPFTFITSNPGKDIRGCLLEAFNLWLNVLPEKLAAIARIVNMLHAASLMLDDIEDNSHLRRGKPAAHVVYGIPKTLNSANYVHILAVREVLGLHGEAGTNLAVIVNDELLALHRGQGLEILWHDSLHCPTEEGWIEMVNNKTGGLLHIGIKLMMACITNANKKVGMLCLNFPPHPKPSPLLTSGCPSPQYTSSKGFTEDLDEGKFSFPIVHSIHANASNHQILNILQKCSTMPALKHHAIDYMQNTTKSFAYMFGVLELLEGKVKREIER
ncbi:terpenoid synthase [Marasmius fiardii PR-910]|nr:terpenoid synthase [Marasmius fiardii PR-910]